MDLRNITQRFIHVLFIIDWNSLSPFSSEVVCMTWQYEILSRAMEKEHYCTPGSYAINTVIVTK